MRKLVVIVIVLFLCQFATQAQTMKIEENQIIIGVIDSVYSDTLEETRAIWIYVPRSATDSSKKFPVVYLLDGNAHYYSVTGVLRQLSVANGNTISPEMIVVAIPNTNRTRDLTPSQVKYFPNSGGAEQFTSFIENELIPYVDEKYPTTPYRTLVGHSWGGLFVVNTLIHHSELFENYVAIDPSIRWNNNRFLNESLSKLQKESFKNKSLFLGIANRIPKGLSLDSVEKDTLKSSEHMRAILKFAHTAEKSEGLKFQWKFYENDSHNSVPLIAEYDALRFLFQWYGFNEEILFDKEVKISVQELLNLILSHYQNISQHFGYTVLPPERLVNRLGDIVLYEKQYDKSFALYQMNMKNYPNSFRVYDAMGDHFRNKKEEEEAIKYYKESLKIEETERTRRKLNNLMKSN